MFLAPQSHAALCSSQRVCFTYTFRHDFTTQVLASLRKHFYLYSRCRLVPGCLTFAPSSLSSSQVPFVRLYSVGYWSSAHDLNYYVNQGGANILNHRETCPSGARSPLPALGTHPRTPPPRLCSSYRCAPAGSLRTSSKRQNNTFQIAAEYNQLTLDHANH